MNVSNLYDFSNKSLICYNTLIHITEYAFWISILSISGDDHKYNYYSDEWIYLINFYYPGNPYYNYFANNYNNIVNQLNADDVICYNNNVISLFTTFSKGSVHGFSGFWYTLITFVNNIDSYDNLDIIMYKECEKGMLSIFNHLCNIGVIKNKVIFLEKNVKYRFASVTYIENEYHVFNGKLENMVTDFIKKYNFINKELYDKTNETCCILKSDKTEKIITYDGVFNNDIVDNFCNKYNITRIFPSNEIELINSIYNCKILILNYGSTFFKNYVYISELCEKIIVIVNGDVYTNDYKHLSSITPNKYQGIIYKKYKNAEIHYIVVNNNLNFDPYRL